MTSWLVTSARQKRNVELTQESPTEYEPITTPENRLGNRASKQWKD